MSASAARRSSQRPCQGDCRPAAYAKPLARENKREFYKKRSLRRRLIK